MLHIVWKSFKANIKNFLAFFISVIMTVNMLFLLMYINEAVSRIKGIETEALAYQYSSSLPKMLRTVIPAIIIVAIAVITYSVRFYVQSRMKDYGMMMVLGIRKKDMRNLVVLEYTLSCGLSCIIGLLLGKGISYLLGKSLENLVGQQFADSIDMVKVYGMALLMCLLMILGVLFAISMLLEERGISNLVKSDVVKEKRLTSKKSLVCLAIGVFLMIIGIMLPEIEPMFQNIALLLLCVGIFITISFGLGYLLECYRNSDKYCRKILVWDQFYHYFNKSKFRIILQTVIGVVVIYFTFTLIVGTLYSRPMPNDFACVTEQGDEFLKEFEEKYKGKEKAFPFVWVNKEAMDSRIGISVSDYNKLFDKEEELEKDEIICVERVDGNPIVDNTETNVADRLYLGRCTNSDITGAQYIYSYEVKKQEIKELIGFSIVGVVVLADETFEEVIEREGFHQDFIIMNVELSDLSSATKFVEEKRQEGILKEAFCKETITDIDRKENILNCMIAGVVGVTILFFSIFVTWLMLFSETEQKIEKYRFLTVTGMRFKERKKTLNTEVGRTIWVPLVLSVILGGGFCGIFIWSRSKFSGIQDGFDSGVDTKVLLLIVMIYVIIQLAFMMVSRLWIKKRVLKGN